MWTFLGFVFILTALCELSTKLTKIIELLERNANLGNGEQTKLDWGTQSKGLLIFGKPKRCNECGFEGMHSEFCSSLGGERD